MTDIASLSIRIDSIAAKQAKHDLEHLADSGKKMEQQMVSMTKAAVKLGVALVAAFSAQQVISKSITAFSVLNRGLIGVQKTTGLLDSEIKALGRSIQDMSTRIPVTTARLLEIAEAAGQLGVKGVKNLKIFTETMAKLESASDVAGEEGAKSIARLLTVTGEAISTVPRFGAVLVALGNTSAASEREILSLAAQVGQATSTFSVTAADTAALGAAMRTLGIQAELSGSIVGRAMRTLQNTILDGGHELTLLMDMTKMTGDQLKATFETNATVVFQKWVEGIGKLVKEGQTAESVLGSFGLKGDEVLKILPTMASRADLLAEALKTANEQVKNATALNNEAAAASKSFSAQMTLTGNTVDKILASIGEGLAPSIIKFTEKFRAWVEVNDEFIKQDMPGYIKRMAIFFLTSLKTMLVGIELFNRSIAGLRVSFGYVMKMWSGAEIKRITNSIAAIEKTFTKTTATGGVTINIKKQQDALKGLGELNAQLAEAKLNYQAATLMVEDNYNAIDEAATSYDALITKINELITTKPAELFTTTTDQADKAADAVKKVGNSFLDMTSSIASMNRTMDKGTSPIDDLGTPIISISGPAGAYREKLESIKADIDNIFSDFDGASFGNAIADGMYNAVGAIETLSQTWDESAKSAAKMQDIQAQINSLGVGDIESRIELTKALEEEGQRGIKNQLSAYRGLFGATAGLFKENSKERKKLHQLEVAFGAIEIALSLKKAATNALEAISSAFAAPFPLNFAAGAAMIGIMSGLGLFGGGGGGSAPSASKTKSGSGTVLGDEEAQSQSADKALDLLEEIHASEYKELIGIHASMKALNQNITGIVTGIAISGIVFDESLVGGIPGNRDLLGGILGSTKYTVEQSGIELGAIAIKDLIKDADVFGRLFVDIQKKRKRLLGSSKTTNYTEYAELDEGVNNLFTQAYKNLSKSAVSLAPHFGKSIADVLGHVFENVKIDLNDMDTAQIEETITGVISSQGDKMVTEVFGDLVVGYYQIGEALLETATRLVAEKTVILSVLEDVGYSFTDANVPDKAIAFTQSIIAIAGSLDDFTRKAGNYYNNFFSDAEKQADLTEKMQDAFVFFGESIPKTRAEFKKFGDGLLSLDLSPSQLDGFFTFTELANQFYTGLEKMKGGGTSPSKSTAQTATSFHESAVTKVSPLADALSSVDEKFASITTRVQAALTPMDEVEQVLANWAQTFTEFEVVAASARLLGKSEEEISSILDSLIAVKDIEVAKAIKNQEEGLFSLLVTIGKSVGSISDYDYALYQLNNEFNGYIETAVALGMDLGEATEKIDAQRTKAIENLEKSLSKEKELTSMGFREQKATDTNFDNPYAYYYGIAEKYGIALKELTKDTILEAWAWYINASEDEIKEVTDRFPDAINDIKKLYTGLKEYGAQMQEVLSEYQEITGDINTSFSVLVDEMTGNTAAPLERVRQAGESFMAFVKNNPLLDENNIFDLSRMTNPEQIRDYMDRLQTLGDTVTEGYREVFDMFAGQLQLVTELQSAINNSIKVIKDDAAKATHIGGAKGWITDQITSGMASLGTGATYDENIAQARELYDLVMSRYDLEKDSISKIETTINDLAGALDSINSKILSLKYSQFNLELPFQKQAKATQDYDKLFSAAKTGDASDINKFLEFVDTYLTTSQDTFKSSTPFQEIFAKVNTDLEQLGINTKDMMSNEEMFLAELVADTKTTIDQLEKIAEYTEGLKTGIQTNIDSLAGVLSGSIGVMASQIADAISKMSVQINNITNTTVMPAPVFTAPVFSSGGASGFGGGQIGGGGSHASATIGGFTPFADGGISTYPQLAMVSEGRYKNEAHVPLPDGRSIPVTLNGGSAGGNVIHLTVELPTGKFEKFIDTRADAVRIKAEELHAGQRRVV